MNTVCIYVNGILTWPGASRNWTGRAVTWTHLHTPHHAEKVEYYIGPLTRPFGQRRRARKLARTLGFYRGWKIILTGHSNGCNVIVNALRRHTCPPIHRINLISAACSASFARTGLNEAPVDHFTVLKAKRDRALLLASTLTGRILGYGNLGRAGPREATVPVTIVEEDFGHSGWFRDEQFDTTMKVLTG